MSADSGADRAEVNATEQRRLEGRLRLAGFPHRKALEESASQPTLDRKLIEELAIMPPAVSWLWRQCISADQGGVGAFPSR